MPSIGIDFAELDRQISIARRWFQFQIVSSPFNPRRLRFLQCKEFSAKQVIIIGPASTVREDLRGVDVNAYDVIVRLNNGIELANSCAGGDLGTRTDILFHNLNEFGDRSAGAIPPSLLRSHGVDACVFPHWTPRRSVRGLLPKLRQLHATSGAKLKVPPPNFCEAVQRELGGSPPTTGTSAIVFFLDCDLHELAIHGFTFFETSYLAGYNDAVQTAGEAREWVAKSPANYNLGSEKQLIRKRILEAERRGVRISLGHGVRKHLYP